MPKVSVIVPVYNVYKYLEKCLDSLVNQTLKDIEIIIVNDGSPDDSQKIIDKYSKKYPTIKSYIKENGGLSDARNYGIKKAHGQYIAFIDSDDFVDITMFEKMYQKAVENNYDMVVCDLYYYYNDNNIVKASSNIQKDTCNIKNVMLNIYPAAWNKIYKRRLFDNKIEFKKGVWFEDVEFIYRLLPYIKSIGVVSEPLIYYVQRQGSITTTINNKIYDYIDNWNGIIEFYQKNNLYNKYKLELEYSYVRYLYATFTKQSSLYNYNDFKKAVTKAIKNVKEHFPNYKKNKYFYKNIKGIYLLVFNKKIAKIIYKKYHKRSEG